MIYFADLDVASANGVEAIKSILFAAPMVETLTSLTLLLPVPAVDHVTSNRTRII